MAELSADDVSCRACGDSGEYVYALGESPMACPHCKPQRTPKLRTGRDELFNANPDCQHEIVELWSGIKCSKCPGWFCL